MLESTISETRYPNGDLQRCQTVRMDSWDRLDFFTPVPSEKAFERITDLYRRFIVPRCPWIFGQLILFRLPSECDFPFSFYFRGYGEVSSMLTAAAIIFRRGVRIVCGWPVFLNQTAHDLWQYLITRNCLCIVRGNLPCTTVLPVGNNVGMLSESETDASLKVNSSFFIMDRFDCSTPYDIIGTPLGLRVKYGKILSPPLFDREALLVDQTGNVTIRPYSLKELSVIIQNCCFHHGENGFFYSRPETRVSPAHRGTDLVIIGSQVAAIHHGGRTLVPSSGFILSIPDTGAAKTISPGDSVSYSGLSDVQFGIQVGNSIVKDGELTGAFVSKFYNIKRLWSTSYPPSLYPLDFSKARAPRIALGADREGHPMLLWAEGAGKFGYIPGKGSCGASLSEMGMLCNNAGMHNAVNLDGGGSAQILVYNQRSLLVSDRNSEDFSEVERAVPAGLIIQ